MSLYSDLNEVLTPYANKINEIKTDLGVLDERVEVLESGSGLTDAVKNALLACFDNVAWKNTNGQTYYDNLYDVLCATTAITLNTNSISMQTIGATSQLTATTTPAGGNVTWLSSNTSVATVSSTGLVTSVAYGSATITATAGSVSATCSVTVSQVACTGITASYTQSGTVYNTDSLNDLKSDLVVTAHYSDSTSHTVTDYTLSGTLEAGTSVISVSYSGKSTTFSVTVSQVTCTGITASYTQSGTVYSDDSLDSLKSDLIVAALYDNGTSQAISTNAYTLTGNLNSATSIITVSYDGKTATFTVTVTAVGSVEYADDLSNWLLGTTPTATYSNGKITLKAETQVNADKYKVFTFDRAKTLWDTVNNKKLRIRITLDSPDWVGDISTSTPLNRISVGAAIYSNAKITGGNYRQMIADIYGDILPVSTPTTYEYIFDADISNFETGSMGTPTNVSTFGVFVYNASMNTIEITDCSIVEVLTS